jgi:hypothetical protein
LPVLAQIVPIRRCNLDCGYCNEYDKTSDPVPLQTMLGRIDRLADLGTTIITLSGGEPTLHPDLDAIIARIRERGAIATLITNGLLLTGERIEKLNRAGVDYLQISIDNARPDEVSKKSLQVLDLKLAWLAESAEFGVTINSVLGAGIRNPEDALAVSRRARSLGFTSTVGILHDRSGQLTRLGDAHRDVYQQLLDRKDSLLSFAHFDSFQQGISRGLPNAWHCRAGGRFLYICEDGLRIIARSSAAGRGFRWRNTPWKICAGRLRVPKPAPHSAPYPACIKPRCWTIFGKSRARRRLGFWNGGGKPIQTSGRR